MNALASAPPAAPTAARLRFVLVRLSRTLRREGGRGLSPSQISAMATVEDLGPMRISTLAAHEGMDPSVATRVVASLESQGLFERADDPEDKRACVVDLTASGREAIAALWRERTVGLTSRLERLSAEERQAVAAAMPALEKLARDA